MNSKKCIFLNSTLLTLFFLYNNFRNLLIRFSLQLADIAGAKKIVHYLEVLAFWKVGQYYSYFRKLEDIGVTLDK